jgi:hypothetical protein
VRSLDRLRDVAPTEVSHSCLDKPHHLSLAIPVDARASELRRELGVGLDPLERVEQRGIDAGEIGTQQEGQFLAR